MPDNIEDIAPVMHFGSEERGETEFRVYVLREGESINDPTSTKEHRRIHGPCIVMRQINMHRTATIVEYPVTGLDESKDPNGGGIWEWLERLITDPEISQLPIIDPEERRFERDTRFDPDEDEWWVPVRDVTYTEFVARLSQNLDRSFSVYMPEVIEDRGEDAIRKAYSKFIRGKKTLEEILQDLSKKKS